MDNDILDLLIKRAKKVGYTEQILIGIAQAKAIQNLADAVESLAALEDGEDDDYFLATYDE